MPIQIIQRQQKERQPMTFDERYGKAINAGFEFAGNVANQYMKNTKEKEAKKELKEKEDLENEFIKTKYGVDLKGATSDEKKIFFAEQVKAERKKKELADKLEMYKKAGFGDYFQNEQQPGGKSFTDQINGAGEGQQERPDIFNEQGEIDVGNINLPTDKLVPESQIAFAAAIDPAVAREMRAHNTAIETRQRHEENLELKKEIDQTKQVSESYKTNQKFIDKTYDQYEDSLRRDSILGRMNELEESGELSDSGIVNTLEGLGLKAEWLKNPSNEEYTKLGLDLLGGGTLQADYGSRVLQSEFKVSQQRIPTLSQTPEGRRQIAENIKTMLLPAKLKNDRMQYYLDRAERTGEPLPHDLRGKVLRDIKPQLEEAYDKFKQRNGRYPVKDGTVPDDNALEKYYFLSDGNQDKAFKMMKEDGYDVQPEGKRGISGGSARTRGR